VLTRKIPSVVVFDINCPQPETYLKKYLSLFELIFFLNLATLSHSPFVEPCEVVGFRLISF